MNQNVCFKLIQKYDGYKALIILEVISIPDIQKDYCSRFTKNIRCINCLQPCPHKYTFKTC